MNIGVLVIVKNDFNFIIPFINHYIQLGFDIIYLIDDNSDKNIQEYINENKHKINKNINIVYIQVDFTHYDFYNKTDKLLFSHLYNEKIYNLCSDYKQIYLYCVIYQKIKTEVQWLLLVDIDEFLYLRDDNDIHDFVKTLVKNNVDLYFIRWLNYGTSFHNQYPTSGHLFENFLYHDDHFEEIGKSIFKTEHFNLLDIHVPYNYDKVPVYSIGKDKNIEYHNSEKIPYYEAYCYIAHFLILDIQSMLERKILRYDATNCNLSFKKFESIKKYLQLNKIYNTSLLKYIDKYKNLSKQEAEDELFKNTLTNYNNKNNSECEYAVEMLIHIHENKTKLYE